MYKMKRRCRPEPQLYPGDPAPEGIQNCAISIRQPYAEAILRGLKTVEYRSQPTRIRGTVYIYAGLKPGNPDSYPELTPELPHLPKGVLIGTVEVVSCIGAPGDYEWHLSNPVRLEVPIKPETQPQPVWFKPFLHDQDASKHGTRN